MPLLFLLQLSLFSLQVPNPPPRATSSSQQRYSQALSPRRQPLPSLSHNPTRPFGPGYRFRPNHRLITRRATALATTTSPATAPTPTSTQAAGSSEEEDEKNAKLERQREIAQKAKRLKDALKQMVAEAAKAEAERVRNEKEEAAASRTSSEALPIPTGFQKSDGQLLRIPGTETTTSDRENLVSFDLLPHDEGKQDSVATLANLFTANAGEVEEQDQELWDFLEALAESWGASGLKLVWDMVGNANLVFRLKEIVGHGLNLDNDDTLRGIILPPKPDADSWIDPLAPEGPSAKGGLLQKRDMKEADATEKDSFSDEDDNDVEGADVQIPTWDELSQTNKAAIVGVIRPTLKPLLEKLVEDMKRDET